jgi:polyphosphate glucokinase
MVPFAKKLSTDLALGNAARKRIGKKKWRKRVIEAINWFDQMLFYDTIYIGGGNAKHLDDEALPDNAQIVPNSAGITGGVRVWELSTE